MSELNFKTDASTQKESVDKLRFHAKRNERNSPPLWVLAINPTPQASRSFVNAIGPSKIVLSSVASAILSKDAVKRLVEEVTVGRQYSVCHDNVDGCVWCVCSFGRVVVVVAIGEKWCLWVGRNPNADGSISNKRDVCCVNESFIVDNDCGW